MYICQNIVMKIVKPLFFFAFILLLVACKSKVSNPIENKWQLYKLSLSSAVNTKFSPEEIKIAEENLKEINNDLRGKMIFEFNSEGKAIAKAPNMLNASETITSNGTWQLSDDEKELILDIEGGVERYDVISIKKDELILEIDNMQMVFIPVKG